MDKSETLWAQYFALPKPSVLLRRYDDGRKNRFYYYTVPEQGKLVVKTAIGITSLLSAVMPTSSFLINWRVDNPDSQEILDNSSEYGTLLHIIYSEWLTKRTVTKAIKEAARDIAIRAGQGHDMVDKDTLSFLKWVEDYNATPLLCEAMILSEPVDGDQYAMTIDLLCTLEVEEVTVQMVEQGVYKSGKRKGQPKLVETKTKTRVQKLALVDFKSNFQEKESKSFYKSHAYQLLAGKKAIKHNFGMDVDIIANFAPGSWKTQPSYSFKTWELNDKDLQKFDLYIRLAQIDGLFNPSGTKFIPPDFQEGVKSSDFKLMSYIEFVENVLLKETPQEQQPEFIEDIESPILSCIDLITE